jgi:hypothetical protein
LVKKVAMNECRIGRSRPKADRAREKLVLGRSEMDLQPWQGRRLVQIDLMERIWCWKQDEFAMLTNIIHQEWTGLSVKKSQDKRTKVTKFKRLHVRSRINFFTK